MLQPPPHPDCQAVCGCLKTTPRTIKGVDFDLANGLPEYQSYFAASIS